MNAMVSIPMLSGSQYWIIPICRPILLSSIHYPDSAGQLYASKTQPIKSTGEDPIIPSIWDNRWGWTTNSLHPAWRNKTLAFFTRWYQGELKDVQMRWAVDDALFCEIITVHECLYKYCPAAGVYIWLHHAPAPACWEAHCDCTWKFLDSVLLWWWNQVQGIQWGVGIVKNIHQILDWCSHQLLHTGNPNLTAQFQLCGLGLGDLVMALDKYIRLHHTRLLWDLPKALSGWRCSVRCPNWPFCLLNVARVPGLSGAEKVEVHRVFFTPSLFDLLRRGILVLSKMAVIGPLM